MESNKLSVGIIMDGNRRWAKARNMLTLEGHTKGYEKLKEAAEWMLDAGVDTLIVYAFSTENKKRSPEEVGYLRDLLESVLEHELEEMKRRDVKVRFVGELTFFSEKAQQLMKKWEVETKNCTKGTLAIALSYGGRAEIVEAARQIAKAGIEPTEEAFASSLWTHDIKDPDIVIRTGGHKRLSNFLLWQCAYSELFFSDTLWPDYSKEEFLDVINSYRAVQKNFGV